MTNENKDTKNLIERALLGTPSQDKGSWEGIEINLAAQNYRTAKHGARREECMWGPNGHYSWKSQILGAGTQIHLRWSTHRNTTRRRTTCSRNLIPILALTWSEHIPMSKILGRKYSYIPSQYLHDSLSSCCIKYLSENIWTDNGPAVLSNSYQ